MPTRSHRSEPPPSQAIVRNAKLDDYIDESILRFGELVRSLRRARRLTQQDIEARAQIASGLLSRVENGQRALALETALRIAVALELQPGQLFSLLNSAQPGGTFAVVGDSTLIIAGGTAPKGVNELTRELESRSAARRKRASRIRRK